jgi:hypothetical protein
LVQTPNLTWTIWQDWSTSRTWKWQPPGPAGNHRIEVDVRDSTRPVQWDQYTVVPYVVNACTGAAMNSNVPSPQVAGTQVVLTGSASTAFCPNPRYQYWIEAPGSSVWTVAQAYSASATFTWNTIGKSPGTYHLSLWVRDAGSTGTVCTVLGCTDTFVPGTSYTLTVAPCTSATASVAPLSPQPAGTTVTITGATSGCPNPRYQFWILAPGGGWTIAQAYSANAAFTWNTTTPIGTYRYSVWARDASSAAGYDAFAPGAAYTLTTMACTSAAASAAPASPQTSGTTITITATASTCPNPRYEFWIQAAGGSWTLAQGYASNATFSWNTTGMLAGTSRYSVWVRDASSGAGYDAFVPGTAYTLTSTPCTSPSASAMPTSPQAHGTTITITASASSCANALYEFWVQAPGGSWTVVRGYSTNASFTWDTTGLPAGVYRYSVWVRDSGSAAGYDSFVPGTAYTLT